MTKRKYTVRVPLRMTEAIHADLQLVSTKAKLPVAAIIRQAIRNYLDDTDLTLGTRRTFDHLLQVFNAFKLPQSAQPMLPFRIKEKGSTNGSHHDHCH
jgi:hypothetical protein